jgi:excisionase family DNA binding protein
MDAMESNDKVLKPGEVAHRLGVDPKTVTRWAKAGKVKSFRLPSGHRRFYESEIAALLVAE